MLTRYFRGLDDGVRVTVESTFFIFLLDGSKTKLPLSKETSDALFAEESRAAFLRDCWVS
jgi:hypothetical protein